MNSEQIPFELNFSDAYEREDFLVSASNYDAVSIIDRWPEWPSHAVVICGPKNSGKTHLCSVWKKISKAETITHDAFSDQIATIINQSNDHNGDVDAIAANYIIDNVNILLKNNDSDIEENLFHLYNHIKSKNGSLLMASENAVNQMNITLKDLDSRLMACPQIMIHSPDDDLLSGLVVKLLKDRQLDIAPDALQYCVSRMERSFEAAFRLIQDLDYKSLSEKRRLTIPLIRELLENRLSEF
jgi:chromosomal replication initiation ATPase DnaA